MLKNKLAGGKSKSLFDTSSIIALIKKEPGYEILEDVIARGAISTVNLTELVSILVRSDIKEIDEIITDIVPEIISFSKDIAIEAGKLIAHTKEYGLSLGDRACIATGIYYNMPIYTADAIWSKLKTKAKIIIVR